MNPQQPRQPHQHFFQIQNRAPPNNNIQPQNPTKFQGHQTESKRNEILTLFNNTNHKKPYKFYKK